jgi:hypothetical protein
VWWDLGELFQFKSSFEKKDTDGYLYFMLYMYFKCYALFTRIERALPFFPAKMHANRKSIATHAVDASPV